jgi:hypothetical protein
MMTTTAAHPKKFPPCPDSLSPAQIEQYWRDGFLAFENALAPAEITEACEAFTSIVRGHAFNPERSEYRPAQSNGGNHSGAQFRSRTSPMFFQLEAGYEPRPDALDDLERKIRKFMGFEKEAPIFERMTTAHPKTHGLLPTLLGGPIALYQSMALIKPANVGSEKPWHQDNAYFSTGDLNGVVGTWIALDDVTIENGCMHVLPGGHRAGPLKHHHTFDCEIEPDRFDRSAAMPIELKAGGILIFHGNLPHQTPRNASDRRRRAVQFHYRRGDNAVIPHEDYDRIFAEADGTPASCAAARRDGF